ncbi:hypothetical protein [Mycobacterium phage Weirdo19]|uniref:Uncharacterized protein n=1 Tax=Mycobacterium phage Weirdo19 TaxID=2601610 RepID=A0A6M2YSV2_9CAUD|nr:hypothetical protein KDJ11_gp39 [Mycobacterium phage Weirdo19]QEA10807.1 hypothetical protein [Mycobacterium phage Weirdo19]
MKLTLTWAPDHAHTRLARWQVRVLARWERDRQAAARRAERDR